MNRETIYAEIANGNIKPYGAEITVTQEDGKTTVEVKDGTPAQGDEEETEEFEIDNDTLTAAQEEAKMDNNYADLSNEDKKNTIIEKYINKVQPKSPKVDGQIRTKLENQLDENQLGGKAKKAKKSAKKGKKSRGMKGKRGRRSAKKGRK